MNSQNVAVLLIILSCHQVSHGFFEGCNRYTSFGYGYRDFFEFRGGNFSPNQIFYLEFYVKTSSDAHILLKPEVSEEIAYEIVIGGGSNTFSQIRSIDSQEKKTMITQKTENFLSADEYRNFWISIDKLGIVSVGKMEDDEVFINWRFDNRIPVKWFSFGSWTNMKADWRFGCKKQNDSDILHEEIVMSNLGKLKRDLFTLYDPNALPVPRNAILDVKVNFLINNLQLDEKRGELTLTGSGTLNWQDSKMKWKPEDYNGIETIFVPAFQIWTPSVRVLNALAVDKSPLFDLTTSGVMAKYDGSITWRVPFKSLSSCNVDLRQWPLDMHNCTIIFGFWMEPPNLAFTIVEDAETTSFDKIDSSWEILHASPYKTTPEGVKDTYGIFYVIIKRRNGPELVVMTVPYIASLVLSLSSFWVPFENSYKLHMPCASILILLITTTHLGNSIPAMTQNVPLILLLYSWTTIVSLIPLLSYVTIMCMEFYISISQSVSKILSNACVSKIFCLSNLNLILNEYSNMRDEVNKSNKNRLFVLRFITVCERIFFLIFLIALILPTIII